MPTYTFLVGTKEAKTQKGQIEASDRYQAAEQLRKQGLYVLNLKKSSQIGPFDIDEIKRRIDARLGGAELSSVERIMFTQHLASMLKTGVPIVEAISTFVDQKGKSKSRQMFKRIIVDLESGLPLSHAFSRFPKTFSPIYTHIVSSGESMGTLGKTLEYLAEQLRRDHELVGRIRAALTYPAVIVTIMVIVLGFITFSVLPKLLVFTENIGRELPTSTRMLISLTSFLTHFGLPLLFGLGLVVILVIRLIKTESGREKFDLLLLHTPLLGKLIRKFNLARFSRLLGAFYHYGIPLPTALTILTSVLPNIYYQRAVSRLKERMARGSSLSNALDDEKEELFPKIMVRVLRSAEKSAMVDDSLWRLADYNESELDAVLKSLTTIIEPVLILFLGMAVVGIALAVVVPIYQITTSFQ